jgi:amino acid transporter
MLMVREMQSMMPHEGGYYHWTKQAFGSFVGYITGWMNWVVSWVDVSIYPVLAAYYLGYFIHEGVAFLLAQEAEIASQQRKVFQFARGPHGDLKKSI